MDIEVYSHTVRSAILGMIIVFAFLGLLCVMMVIIKKIFDKPAKEVEKAQVTPVATVVSASADNDSWVVAAVVAFLEQEDIPVSAMSWLPPPGEKQDPWVSMPKLQNHAARALS